MSLHLLKTFLFDNKSWILVIHFCVFTILDHLDKAFVVSFRHLYILNIRLRVKLGIFIRSDMWKNLKGLFVSTWTHHFVISQGKTYVTVLINESKMYKYKGVSYIMLAQRPRMHLHSVKLFKLKQIKPQLRTNFIVGCTLSWAINL